MWQFNTWIDVTVVRLPLFFGTNHGIVYYAFLRLILCPKQIKKQNRACFNIERYFSIWLDWTKEAEAHRFGCTLNVCANSSVWASVKEWVNSVTESKGWRREKTELILLPYIKKRACNKTMRTSCAKTICQSKCQVFHSMANRCEITEFIRFGFS